MNPPSWTLSIVTILCPYSRSESRNYLDFLDLRPGFEPEGRGFESLAACDVRCG
jgi:hypothetical protein